MYGFITLFCRILLLYIYIMMSENLKAYLALAVVCVVWGTTYFAMRIGVSSFPPFLFSGSRQVCAGLMMLGYVFIVKKESLLQLSVKDMATISVSGILMIALGNGVMGWSERYIPSGLAALVVSIMPVYVVCINYVSGIDRKIPNKYILWGLAFGSLGILLIFRDNLRDLANPDYVTGLIVAFLATLAWACGSIYTKHKPVKTDVLAISAIQLLSGGIALMVMSLFFDDYTEIAYITTDSWYALLYLITFGSLFAYSCFVYTLEKLPVGLASIYAYINPFIAILLGYLFLDEKLTWMTGWALVAVLTGVYFINKGYVKQKSIRK